MHSTRLGRARIQHPMGLGMESMGRVGVVVRALRHERTDLGGEDWSRCNPPCCLDNAEPNPRAIGIAVNVYPHGESSIG